MNPVRALILTERPDDPAYRYRIKAFLPALAAEGIAAETVTLRRGFVERTRQLAATSRADVVILQRKLMSMAQIGVLRAAARRIIFDFDDALFHREYGKGNRYVRWKLAARFWATVRAADLIIAGNEYLRQHAAMHTDPARVRVVPTCVDPARYELARHEAVGARARLVWIGQRAVLHGMAGAGLCLDAAARKLPGLALRLICDTQVPIGSVPIEFRPWSSASEAGDLAAADIGVSWLADNPYNRGKCGLRTLQYMAAGLPVVANRIGVSDEMVVHGKTGYLASTPDEWAEAIARLAENPALRREMGAAGRRLVEERYCTGVWAPRFAAMVREAAEMDTNDELLRPRAAFFGRSLLRGGHGRAGLAGGGRSPGAGAAEKRPTAGR